MTDQPAWNDDFRDLFGALCERQVRFVVVGAHAMAVHGVPRATGDIDVLVEPTGENAVRVVSALQDFGAPLAAHGVSETDFSQSRTVYQLGVPPRRIDLLTTIDGVTFDEAWRGRHTVERDGLQLPVLGLEELKTNKKASGRDKDLVDLRLLRELEP